MKPPSITPKVFMMVPFACSNKKARELKTSLRSLGGSVMKLSKQGLVTYHTANTNGRLAKHVELTQKGERMMVSTALKYGCRTAERISKLTRLPIGKVSEILTELKK